MSFLLERLFMEHSNSDINVSICLSAVQMQFSASLNVSLSHRPAIICKMQINK